MRARKGSSSRRSVTTASVSRSSSASGKHIDTRKLCLDLLAAESEAAVEALFDTSVLRDAANWRPLDRRETNFNITSNQASDGGKALTELMTNMVDAVLMKHAYLKGIDPKSPKAPRTMYEAVDKLIKPLHGGKLVNLDPKDPWLREFASKNLVIGITGAKNKKEGLPCYTFVDNGEGQRPGDFEKTFLSLSEGNKRSIPFVQGKYNMGSSGVLGYCGRRWFKLIISRRYDGKSAWGWTLMRRRPGEGMPIAEYFVLPGGTMPSFEADVLYPFTKNDCKRYDGIHLATGTVIKLYDYQVGSKFLSFRGAREALNENLVETILPFRLLDFRQKPDPKRTGERAEGIDPRPFYGMEFLLLRSHKEGDAEDEDEAVGTELTNVGKVVDPELGEITIEAIPLKRSLPSWLSPANTINRVFHAVNGQVQFKQTRGYMTDCGFPALKDRVIIVVDASNLTFAAHNDVWKGDREHIRNTIVGERYREFVTKTIKESTALQDLQKQVAVEELNRAAQSERNDLFQKLVDADRNLALLLSERDPVIFLPASGEGADGDRGTEKFQGKYSPTFLRLEEKQRAAKGIEVPINRSRPVAARTDAENGYLNRADNRGRVVIRADVAARFTIREQLHDGRLIVKFEPLEGKVDVGDSFTFRIELVDGAMPQPVGDELTLRIIEEEAPPPPKPPRPGPRPPRPVPGTEGSGKAKEGQGENAPTHGLPKYVLLTRDGRTIGDQGTEKWPDGFDENDGGTMRDLGDNQLIYLINYDNTYHLRYRVQQRGDLARDVVTEKYILGMRIMMLGYEHALRMRAGGLDGIKEYIDDFRRMAARGAASTVLALAENLPRIVDKTSVAGEAE